MASGSRSLALQIGDIASLGEQIVNSDLSGGTTRPHRRHDVQTDHRGCGRLALRESFPFTILKEENVFPEEPELQGMQRAIKAEHVLTKQLRAKSTKKARLLLVRPGRRYRSSSRDSLGALQVTRNRTRI